MLMTGGGISPVEVYLIESLSHVFSPKNIFIVGNAFGWSTFVMALAFKNAKIVALDAGIYGKDNMFGIDLTNRIALENGFNCFVEYGFSPEKTEEVVKKHFGEEKIDLVFIDGLHTNEQQLKDFYGIKNYCNENTVYLFHDVINLKMTESFNKIKQSLFSYKSWLLYRTSSGMGVCVPAQSTAIMDVFNAFSEDEQRIKEIQKMEKLSWKIKAYVFPIVPAPIRKTIKKLIKGMWGDK